MAKLFYYHNYLFKLRERRKVKAQSKKYKISRMVVLELEQMIHHGMVNLPTRRV
jgi:hypothetical protein